MGVLTQGVEEARKGLAMVAGEVLSLAGSKPDRVSISRKSRSGTDYSIKQPRSAEHAIRKQRLHRPARSWPASHRLSVKT